jgi:hypothetical protein
MIEPLRLGQDHGMYIAFDFKSTTIGEIHGIGLDNNTGISSSLTYRVAGSQTWWGIQTEQYQVLGKWQHFVIDLSNLPLDIYDRLTFVADQDNNRNLSNSQFKNVVIGTADCFQELSSNNIKENTQIPVKVFYVYPNPTNGDFTIGEHGGEYWELNDIYGRIVIKGTSAVVKTDNLVPGTYVLSVNSQRLKISIQ